jgi:hypothetical protein
MNMQLRIHKPDRHVTKKSASPAQTRAAGEPVYSWTDSTADVSIRRKADCSCGGTCPACQGSVTIQPKLRIGAVHDPAEREADAMADRVMRMVEPGLQRQAKPEEEEEEEKPVQTKRQDDSVLRRQADEDEDESEAALDTKRAHDTPAAVSPRVHDTLRQPGQPLDSSTRHFMEQRFRSDFSGVRVHADNHSAWSAADVNARAYTVRNHIVFGTGEYAPDTASGRWLLAHELAHTLQQSSRAGYLRRQPPSTGGSGTGDTSGTSGAQQLLATLLTDQQLQADLSTITADDINPSNFCRPFPTRAHALRWQRILERLFLPAITSGLGPQVSSLLQQLGQQLNIPTLSGLARVAGTGFGTEVGDLWRRFVTGPRRQQRARFTASSSQIVQGFAGSVTTGERQDALITRLKARLPRLCRGRSLRRLRPNRWIPISVTRLFTRRDINFPIDYNRFTEIAGNIAGGVSGSRYGRDSRRLQGSVLFFRETNAAGRTVAVRIRTQFQFVVRDTVDFCPGGAGASVEQTLTVPLSRLEASGVANDVPYLVIYDAPQLDATLDASLVRRCWP